MKTKAELFQERYLYHRKGKIQRHGQATFNAACDVCPEIANELRGTEFDCFYDDDKADIFLSKIFKNEE